MEGPTKKTKLVRCGSLKRLTTMNKGGGGGVKKWERKKKREEDLGMQSTEPRNGQEDKDRDGTEQYNTKHRQCTRQIHDVVENKLVNKITKT